MKEATTWLLYEGGGPVWEYRVERLEGGMTRYLSREECWTDPAAPCRA